MVSAANLNTPNQIVISGHVEAVERAGVKAKELGAKRVIPLSVSAPFHCSLMKPAEVRLEPELRGLVVRDPSVPVVANVDDVASLYSRDSGVSGSPSRRGSC